MVRPIFKILALACIALPLGDALESVAAPPNRVAQGGGVIYPAWTGEYWSNSTMEGEPDWTRSDIRIRFDWEDWRPVIGVRAESVADFPTDHFSTRWTGKLISRFAETYTISLESDAQARLKIKEASAPQWTTLIDAWSPHPRRVDTAEIMLDPQKVYDVMIEYVEDTGDAVCVLRWSSPSTPTEVVDYVAANTVHAMFPQMLGDIDEYAGRGGQNPANTAATQGTNVDENGDPTEDFNYIMLNGFNFHAGTGKVRFEGLAEVEFRSGTFLVDGQQMKVLPKGTGYDPQTNRTTALVRFADRGDGTNTTEIKMRETQRSPDAPVGSGIADLSVVLARQVNGDEPMDIGEISSGEVRDTFKPVFAWRNQRTGINDIVKWDERTKPAYSKINGQVWRSDMAYEKLMVMANEIGRDFHLNYGGSIDEEFMRNLLLLAKYGSDGENPYTEPTQDPVWPPLAPHLRLYLEHGNEMGWSAIQPRGWYKDYEQIRKQKSGPIWDAINFDSAIDNNHHWGLMRLHAYRSARMGLIAREVFGDEAMGETVRNMIFGQYERWFQNGLMQFVEDYFNNPEEVVDPRPVSEIFWAAGPAVYYGTTNNFAVADERILVNGNFESPELDDGQAWLRPDVEGWRFAGNAGIVNNQVKRHVAFEAPRAGETRQVSDRSAVGYRFTVGPEDLYVFEVGRNVYPGDRGRGFTHIFDADGDELTRTKHGNFELKDARPGQSLFLPTEYNAWATSDSSRVGVWKLKAGQTYSILTNVESGEIADATRLSAGEGFTIDAALLLDGQTIGSRKLPDEPMEVAGDGMGFPQATFRYGFAIATRKGRGPSLAPSDPLVDPTWREGGKGKSGVPPYHREGHQLAFLAGRAKISQDFTIDEAGEYALIFTGNTSVNTDERNGENPLTIRIGGEVVWDQQVMGLARKPKGGLFQWGTHYIHLEPGTHTLEIESHAETDDLIAYLYAMHLGNMMDYAGGETASNFLGSGAATGQTDGRFALVAKFTTAMAQLWGVVPYAYEGGTQAGGDWGGQNLFYAEQFKWDHPVSRAADNQWARFWHDHGGMNAFYYYPGFEYGQIHRAEDFMPWAAAIDRAQSWEMEPLAETIPAAPLRFTPSNPHYQSEPGATWAGWYHPFSNEDNYRRDVTDQLSKPGQWKGTVFRVEEAGPHRITVHTNDGGRVALKLNDSQSVAEGPSGQRLSTQAWLTRGVHGLRIENLEGDFKLHGLTVEPIDSMEVEEPR
jgi:hypothetical protein